MHPDTWGLFAANLTRSEIYRLERDGSDTRVLLGVEVELDAAVEWGSIELVTEW